MGGAGAAWCGAVAHGVERGHEVALAGHATVLVGVTLGVDLWDYATDAFLAQAVAAELVGALVDGCRAVKAEVLGGTELVCAAG